MPKVLISFLGTSLYTPCTYKFKEQRVSHVSYVQEAIVVAMKDNFNAKDRFTVFLTHEAEKANWDRTEYGEGLHHRLIAAGFPGSIEAYRIQEMDSEESLWGIFNTIFSILNNEDDVYLDITHGFRSLPMLGIVLLNYARVVKNIHVKGIYYSAFESSARKDGNGGDLSSEQVRPIFDLTGLDSLLQWAQAANSFVRHGEAQSIADLIYRGVNPILAETKGGDEAAKVSKEFVKTLNKVASIFIKPRGKTIYAGTEFIALKKLIEKIKGKNVYARPMEPLLNMIQEAISPYKTRSTINGFFAVKWCIDHELVQQGITMLQEAIITYILDNCSLAWEDKINRQILSAALITIPLKKEITDPCDILYKHRDIVQRITDSKDFNELEKPYNMLRDHRNDINHGGYISDFQPGDFSSKLEKAYKIAMEYIEKTK